MATNDNNAVLNTDTAEACATPPLRVLVVEDHFALREVTVEALSRHGYQVMSADCAEAVYELPAGSHFEIALVDLKLPGENGLSLAARLRQTQPDVGIVILSGSDALEEKLAGYRSGADIYLTKPTSPEELCAAIDAVARRLKLNLALGSADYWLELASGTLTTPKGVCTLRRREVEVLYALALAPEHFLERWQLLERLGKPLDIYGNAQLEVLISRLRSRLRPYIPDDNPVRAERNQGYRLGFLLQVR